MSSMKSFFAGAALFALALVLYHGLQPAHAGGMGPFQLMHHSNQTANVGVFRIDTSTGEISYCYMTGTADLACTRGVR